MKEYFPQITKIPFEGTESMNPMAFHYYEADRTVMGRKMKDWLKFAMAWWHTLGQASGDQFGGQTRHYAWDEAEDVIQRAKDKVDAGFEIMDKLGIEYFCFHDVDLIEEGDTIEEYEHRMNVITDYIKEKRIREAARLLRDSSLTVEDVMSRVGYTDKNHFYKNFKEIYQMTPAAYRKNQVKK